MSKSTHYICHGQRLAMIEALFAANGYAIEIPLQASANGTSAMVMTCGAASILLGQVADSNRVELEVWGRDPRTAMGMVEALLIRLARQPQSSTDKGYAERYVPSGTS